MEMAYVGILIDHPQAAQFQYPLKLPGIFQAISIGYRKGDRIECNLNPIQF